MWRRRSRGVESRLSYLDGDPSGLDGTNLLRVRPQSAHANGPTKGKKITTTIQTPRSNPVTFGRRRMLAIARIHTVIQATNTTMKTTA